jgi:hypothetical protein
MSNGSICPCEGFVFPRIIGNPPGLSSIAYRAGDFTDFRHALLVIPRKGEVALANWRPSAASDLAVQMVEWWAYLADILTFYNQRIASQDYLATADLPESVGRLIRVLGYRPRPGIGATGILAAILNKEAPLTLPAGFAVQSKPGPGQPPQIFEIGAATAIAPPDLVAAFPLPNPALVKGSGGNDSVLLAGTISSIKPGDELLVVESGWNASDSNWALGTVASSSSEKAPDGTINTRVVFSGTLGLPGNAAASDYQLLKSTQSAHAWQYPANNVIQDNLVNLESAARAIKAGDVILFEATRTISVFSNPPAPQLASVITYTEVIWYANAPDPNNPQTPPTKAQQDQYGAPIPIPHSELKFRGTPGAGGISAFNSWSKSTVIRYGWQSVGQLIPTPATAIDPSNPQLGAVAPAAFPAGSGTPVMIEDANGNGASAVASSGAPSLIELGGLPAPMPSLTPPLNVLYGRFPVSRGKTVTNEILGSGDATQAGQEFVLKNSPLTYLLSQSSISGQNYGSTLTVRVNGVAWQEVGSFYGQSPDAKVFVTSEDENNQTHVMFGDGVNGARLPSGTNNVVATYRFGSGAASPAAGALTVIMQPQPNLKAIHNPVAVGGGADPDPPSQIRRYAPQSVLTFGRAISADDYQTIAAQAPGVARARSYFSFDAAQQRALVTLYVGDDPAAVTAAQTALALADDPNRPVLVKLAFAVPIQLYLTVLVDPKYDTPTVLSGVTAALIDPQNGLLGGSIGIGQTIYDSQIYQSCLSVPGADAVHALSFVVGGIVDSNEMHSPGMGGFFQLTGDQLFISSEAASNVE